MQKAYSKRINVPTKCLIALILYAILFCGALTIGPLSVRNYTALLLGIWAIFSRGKTTIDIVGKLYFAYLGILIVATIITDQLTNETFYKNFLAYHLVCIIIIYAFPKLFSNQYSIDFFFKVIIFFYITNIIISILQYLNNPLGWELGTLFNMGGLLRMENQADIIESGEYMNKSIIMGINGFVVTNGYFIATFLPITAYTIFSKKKNRQSLFGIIILITGYITAFLIQQRMGFYVISALIILIILKTFRGSTRFFIILGILIIGVLYSDIINEIDFGRLTNMEDKTRSRTLEVALNLANSSDFWFGHNLDDMPIFLVIGHNSLLDAFRRGGIFALVLFFILFFTAFFKTIKLFLQYNRTNAPKIAALALSSCVYIIYSLTHSNGIQSGAVFFWIIYSVLLSQLRIMNIKEGAA